jgi:hypothetical protein
MLTIARIAASPSMPLWEKIVPALITFANNAAVRLGGGEDFPRGIDGGEGEFRVDVGVDRAGLKPLKSEARLKDPKPEIRSKSQIPNPKRPHRRAAACAAVGIFFLGFLSDFGLRISDFRFTPAWCTNCSYKMSILSHRGHQLPMRSALDDLPGVDHQDAIRPHDRAQAVGHDERRAAFQQFSSELCTSSSVPVSTALVASSSMKMRGSARNARVKQINCRWPRLMLEPRSPTSVWIAILQRLDRIVAADRAGGVDHFFIGGLRLGIADVFHDRAAEQIIHLQHQAHLPVQRIAGDVSGCPAHPPARGPAAVDRTGRSAR